MDLGMFESLLLGPYIASTSVIKDTPFIYALCHFWGAYDESRLIILSIWCLVHIP